MSILQTFYSILGDGCSFGIVNDNFETRRRVDPHCHHITPYQRENRFNSGCYQEARSRQKDRRSYPWKRHSVRKAGFCCNTSCHTDRDHSCHSSCAEQNSFSKLEQWRRRQEEWRIHESQFDDKRVSDRRRPEDSVTGYSSFSGT